MTENTPPTHDDRGRFAKGNKASRGNPTGRRQRVRQKALTFLLDELTKDDSARLRSIVQAWVADAIEGQTARKYLLDRLLGMSADSEAMQAIDRIQKQVVKMANEKGAK